MDEVTLAGGPEGAGERGAPILRLVHTMDWLALYCFLLLESAIAIYTLTFIIIIITSHGSWNYCLFQRVMSYTTNMQANTIQG